MSDRNAVSQANIEISGNTISNIQTNSGHRDGVGIVVGTSATISGNRISNAAHYGVRVEDGRSNGSQLTVNITNNTFSSIGIAAVWSAADRANINQSGNSGA